MVWKGKWKIVRRVGFAVALPLSIPVCAPQAVVPALRYVTIVFQASAQAAAGRMHKTLTIGIRA